METSEQVASALRLLGKLEREEVSDVTVVVEMVARAVLCRKPLLLSTLIKLTQIAARLDATVCDTFRFVTRDLKLHSKTDNLIFDADGTLEAVVPAAWVQTHFLHESYSRTFESCTREEWLSWASSGRSGLFTFAPLSGVPRNIYTRHDLRIELQDRGCEAPDTFPYKTTSFVLVDRDFDDQFWEHWNVFALEDDRFWGRLVERVLTQPTSYWLEAATAKVLQKSSSGVTKPVLDEGVPTRWILKLRELRCLPDTHGTYRLPSDLLRRTPATEPLRDVEPFVHARLDTETTRPLLDLLGVRHVPTGPERILQCLRALTRADHPPTHEVRKWYERLDELITTCTTVELSEIKQAFHDEKIVLTQDGGWTNAAGAFLAADEEDAPGSALVFDAVRDLTLWRRIGVAERPSADRVIHWLKELQSGSPLSPDDARRVRALLPRHPLRIHSECGHWLNLAREWAPVDSLDYALTMQSLVEWGHLDESVKQRTADLQRLPGEVTSAPPFSDWPLLSDRIEERVHRNPRRSSVAERKPWLNELGALLRRIVLEDKAATARVRQLAADLEETVWQVSTELEVLPYLDGAPAGAPRSVDVMWLDRVLYVDSLPSARLARLVPDRVGRIFGRPEIAAAMSYCFSRSKHDVAEYIEQNFVLEPLEFCQASSDVVPVLGAKAGSQTRGDAGLPCLEP